MTDKSSTNSSGRDYSDTLNLPKTDFPMRAGLPKKEPEIVARWQKMDLYKRLRENARGREKYVLHDGPPYANGNLHIGHALNKILKDIITRSFQMRGYDSNYVPGWDCHGLPIEWKIEEQYRAKGRNKDDVPVHEFRQECRDFANHWVGVQSKEFERLGVIGDFKNPYLTMDYSSEAIIAGELMKFAESGQLYRGSKPIMWSVVERTALAEAEIEYEIVESDTIWTGFPIVTGPDYLQGSKVVIWTTTPWTIPANRCVCYSQKVSYGLYEVINAENDFGPQSGDKFVFADSLAQQCADKAKVTLRRSSDVPANDLAGMVLYHPLRGMGVDGYQFLVPMLQGDHVTDEAGTGFVHTAPGHGRDDFENWVAKREEIEALGISSAIPFCVADDGSYTDDAPGFVGVRVMDDKGKKGKANQAVITALIGQNNLFARGRVKHDYPHSWRSKKPIIFRNTPQWFVHMDKTLDDDKTLRERALSAIDETRFVPTTGQNRLRAMIEQRPDWVLSRQRAWGVPITVFRNPETEQVIPGPEFAHSLELAERIKGAFEYGGADVWYADGAKEAFLQGLVDNTDEWEQVTDILDVWFDSGSTHAFCLKEREDLKWPADLYLEGSDQHRGWFHSSLLESCGTTGRAPYDAVLTHGFTVTEDGKKMSKSIGNDVAPQDIIKQYGADIIRLWVSSIDYTEDQRIGPEVIKTAVDAYRKMRNTLRWMLGTLSHDKGEKVALSDMPELEQVMLHRLSELDVIVRKGYDDFDFKRVFAQVTNFMNVELSAFYFDIRKDALYCDPISSVKRKASIRIVSHMFDCVTTWLAPMMAFTMEETWLTRYQGDIDGEHDSVHLQQFPTIPEEWRNDELAAKWKKIRQVRKVVTGALEIERREKRIGSSLEASLKVYINDVALAAALDGQDFAEICITSQIEIVDGSTPPTNAFSLEDVAGVSVVPVLAVGNKCARSWRILPEVGSDPQYPDISLRDAEAMRELESV
jgi:isoleucyl-tRNA synthetase